MSSAPQLHSQPRLLRTALVVDADPEVEAMLSETLDPASWTIQHAPSNHAVLALAEARPFDLILTSEKTSGKQDVELLRSIRRAKRRSCQSVSSHPRLFM
jgi:DNA-binding response OmpR family regulator